MRRVLYLFFALSTLLSIAEAGAQTIALGERAPRIKKATWFNSTKPPQSDFTFIQFIHSASVSCRQATERLGEIVEAIPNATFIVVTHQSAGDIDSWVSKCAKPRTGIIVDDIDIRNSFGVNYAPYVVILDYKSRVLWFGNPQLLDRKAIDKIMAIKLDRPR